LARSIRRSMKSRSFNHVEPGTRTARSSPARCLRSSRCSSSTA
jgi:hypothetical protein